MQNVCFFDNLFDYTVCIVNTVNIEIVTFLCFLFQDLCTVSEKSEKLAVV